LPAGQSDAEGGEVKVHSWLRYLAAAIAGAGVSMLLPGGLAVAAPPPVQAAAWTAAQAPLPANADSSPGVTVYGISCPSSSFCMAGGAYSDTAGDNEGLLLTRSAGKWTAAEAPLPSNAVKGGAGVTVYGVACPSASFCIAGGTYADNAGFFEGLLLTWSAGKWKAAEAPVPGNADPEDPDAAITGVSCASVSSCVADGSYVDGNGFTHGQLLMMAGGKWKVAEAPVPANAASNPDAPLHAVSCPSASSCVAGGSYFDTAGDQEGLLLTLSAGKWSAAQSPLPHSADSDPQATVTGASCASASACAAVGTYANADDEPTGLLLTLSGGKWSAAAAPQPHSSSAPFANSYGISCPSASSCAAVGSYIDSAGDNAGLLLTLSAGKWSAAEAPLPANAGGNPGASVYGISCASASACAAVGTYTTTTGDAEGLLLTVSGGI
jgi:hypothetical protein